jgi:hypothetical protein
MNWGSYPQVQSQADNEFSAKESALVFFVQSKTGAIVSTSAIEAETPADAITCLLRNNSVAREPVIYGAFRVDFTKRTLDLAESNLPINEATVREFRQQERNPIKIGTLLDYTLSEFGDKMTPNEKRALRSVKKKIVNSIGL